MRWSILFVAVRLYAASDSSLSTARADYWITNAAAHPVPWSGFATDAKEFQSLHAEVVAETLQIIWPASLKEASTATVYFSADPLGHWPARDWQSTRLRRQGNRSIATIPVDNVNIPIAYFVVETRERSTNVSPMRVCSPRALGLEQPTRYFWSFLDGFEQCSTSWRSFSTNQALALIGQPRSGKAALEMRSLSNQHSVAVGTTRVRGWYAEEHGAKGIGVWIRTERGSGRARVTLFAHAFSTNQVAMSVPEVFAIGERWQRMQVPFGNRHDFPFGDLDFIAFDFTAESGTTFWLDDLHLIGHWAAE